MFKHGCPRGFEIGGRCDMKVLEKDSDDRESSFESL